MATKRARACATILGLSALLWVTGPANADATAQAAKGHSETQFVGSSTLHDFAGEVRSRPFELSLESFGLEVPPVLGLLRVGDVVRVRVRVILDALAGESHQEAVFDRPLEPLASGS